MNKEDFLKILEQRLREEKVEDPAPYLDYFEEILADMREEGLAEEEALSRLGDPSEIAKALAAEIRPRENAADQGRQEEAASPRDERGSSRSEEKDGRNDYTYRGEHGFSYKGAPWPGGAQGLSGFIKDIVRKSMWGVPDSGEYFEGSGGRSFPEAEMSFPVQGIRRLDINWLDGDIELKATEREDILVSEDRSAKASPMIARIEGDCLKLSYSEEFQGQEKGRRIWTGFNRSSGKDLRIEIPFLLAENLKEARLRSISGDMELAGLSAGELILDTVNGDLCGENLSGEKWYITSVNGDVELSGRAKQIDAESTSGDLELYLKICPDILNARAVSGDIDVTLPAGSACRIKHSSISGYLSASGVRTDAPEAAEFSFETVSGDINIRAEEENK